MELDVLVERKVADLKIQAMMFDLDIDFETLELIPKETYKEPFWLSRWKDKLDNSDYMPDGSDDQEWSEDGRR